MSKKLAALDLGSNSFHLLVADQRPGGRIRRRATQKITLRLAEPVARTGKLGPDARQRAHDAIAELLDTARDEGADRVVAVATDALRRAEDGQRFRDELVERHGLPVQVVTGQDEAALSLRAMATAFNLGHGERMLGVDLGGGSLDIAYGGIDGAETAVTLPLGSATVSTRLSDPPRLAERIALYQHAAELLGPAIDKLMAPAADGERPPQAAGTAGTIRDLGRLGLALASGKKPDRVRGLLVSRDQLELAYGRLCSVSVLERMELPGVSKKRGDLLPAGGTVILCLMELLDLGQLKLCDWGLREGALLDVVAGGDVIDPDRVVALD